MAKMSELSQVLDELVTCGENLIRTANTLRDLFSETPIEQSQPAEPEEQKEEPAQRVAPKYSFIDVRKAFSAKSHAGYTEQVKALITKYGADKLSAVKEEDYAAIMADLEAIG